MEEEIKLLALHNQKVAVPVVLAALESEGGPGGPGSSIKMEKESPLYPVREHGYRVHTLTPLAYEEMKLKKLASPHVLTANLAVEDENVPASIYVMSANFKDEYASPATFLERDVTEGEEEKKEFLPGTPMTVQELHQTEEVLRNRKTRHHLQYYRMKVGAENEHIALQGTIREEPYGSATGKHNQDSFPDYDPLASFQGDFNIPDIPKPSKVRHRIRSAPQQRREERKTRYAPLSASRIKPKQNRLDDQNVDGSNQNEEF
jgi:hypothetical protein